MNRIIASRGTGKTINLMRIAKDNNAIFVCSNPRAMEYKAKHYGIEGITFISYDDFVRYDHNKEDKYVIDEIESFVNYTLSGDNLIGYTLSIDSED